MADGPNVTGGYQNEPEVFAVAHEVPTEGLIDKPGAEGQTPDTVPFVAFHDTGDMGPAPDRVVVPEAGDAGGSAAPVQEIYSAAGVPADAGNTDPGASSVQASMDAAHARLAELQSDVTGYGGPIGDLMNLPNVPGYESKHAGPPPESGGTVES